VTVTDVIRKIAQCAGTHSAQARNMSAASTIRHATEEDLPEIQRLLDEAGLPALPAGFTGRGGSSSHLLVLEAPEGGGLAAAALLVVDHHRGTLSLLAVDRRYHGLGLEERIMGVSQALCRAFGAHELDVQSIHQHM
jgi:N-acetylglutamate synthase-like GNAT family acetyltransferase